MRHALALLPLMLLLPACNGNARSEVGSAEQPLIGSTSDGATCPAGEDCFAPEHCAEQDVICPAGEDCFAPELCADEERVLGAAE